MILVVTEKGLQSLVDQNNIVFTYCCISCTCPFLTHLILCSVYFLVTFKFVYYHSVCVNGLELLFCLLIFAFWYAEISQARRGSI